MDRIIYLVSANYVSAGTFRRLAVQLEESAPCFAQAIRLEGTGAGVWQALDAAKTEGATRIELRPVGLPFSESLARWLPGAVGSWLAQQTDTFDVFLADVVQEDVAVVRTAARARVALRRIEPTPLGHKGKGWDAPPAFKHHLLVCAGPRCHLLDAPSLADALKHEINAAALSRDCLVTTTGCLFPCNQGPVAVHYPIGDWYRLPDISAVRRFVSEVLGQGAALAHFRIHQTGARTHEDA
jgi:(2Fe-2S) ferredoxin